MLLHFLAVALAAGFAVLALHWQELPLNSVVAELVLPESVREQEWENQRCR